MRDALEILCVTRSCRISVIQVRHYLCWHIVMVYIDGYDFVSRYVLRLCPRTLTLYRGNRSRQLSF